MTEDLSHPDYGTTSAYYLRAVYSVIEDLWCMQSRGAGCGENGVVPNRSNSQAAISGSKMLSIAEK